MNSIVGELRDPVSTLIRSIFIAIPLVTVLYVLTNISYFSVLSKEDILSSNAVAVVNQYPYFKNNDIIGNSKVGVPSVDMG